MDEQDQERPQVNKPLHGEPRPRLSPVLAVVGMIVAIVVVVAIITLLRYYAS
jgi:hypothetical protein